jgi:hypothetical protein
MHSDNAPVKPKQQVKPELTPNHEGWNEAIKFLKGEGTISKIRVKYVLSQTNEEILISESLK